jgi:hypothetical protein
MLNAKLLKLLRANTPARQFPVLSNENAVSEFPIDDPYFRLTLQLLGYSAKDIAVMKKEELKLKLSPELEPAVSYANKQLILSKYLAKRIKWFKSVEEDAVEDLFDTSKQSQAIARYLQTHWNSRNANKVPLNLALMVN